MRTTVAFRRWLEAKIRWAEGSVEFNESENEEARDLITQARDFAVDLRLPAAAAAASKGPPRLRLLEVLNAIAEQPEFLTIRQVVDMTGLSEKTIRRRVNDKTLPPPMKIGRASRWRRLDIENFKGKY